MMCGVCTNTVVYVYTVQCAICLQHKEISHPVCTADLHNLATASELRTSLLRIQMTFYSACCAGRWLKSVLKQYCLYDTM